MSDTKQLEPPPLRPVRDDISARRKRWWRRHSASVLAVSVAVHLLFALVAGYFIVQHFTVVAPPQRPVAPPSPPSPPNPRHPAVSPPAPLQHVVTTSISTVTLPETTSVSPEVPLPVLPSAPAVPGVGLATNLQNIDIATAQGPSPFGRPEIRDGLRGRFFDLKQDRFGRSTGMTMDGYSSTVEAFVKQGWQDRDLTRRFLSSPDSTLGIHRFFIPSVDAAQGPAAFRMEKKVEPTMWLAHYRGTVVAPVSGRYHFVGAGDDVMLVALGGRLVLDRCYNLRIKDAAINYDYGYSGIPKGFARGDAMDIVAARPYPIDVLIGEEPGGKFFAFLFLEKEGETYPKDGHGNSILPVFQVKMEPLPVSADGVKLPPFDPEPKAWSVWSALPPDTR